MMGRYGTSNADHGDDGTQRYEVNVIGWGSFSYQESKLPGLSSSASGCDKCLQIRA